MDGSHWIFEEWYSVKKKYLGITKINNSLDTKTEGTKWFRLPEAVVSQVQWGHY